MSETPALTYWVAKEFEGLGIATEAVALFLELFTERPIFGHVVRHNFGSKRVLEKTGFELVDQFESEAPAHEEPVIELEYRLS